MAVVVQAHFATCILVMKPRTIAELLVLLKLFIDQIQ
jgi:hypothetical protein